MIIKELKRKIWEMYWFKQCIFRFTWIPIQVPMLWKLNKLSVGCSGHKWAYWVANPSQSKGALYFCHEKKDLQPQVAGGYSSPCTGGGGIHFIWPWLHLFRWPWTTAENFYEVLCWTVLEKTIYVHYRLFQLISEIKKVQDF